MWTRGRECKVGRGSRCGPGAESVNGGGRVHVWTRGRECKVGRGSRPHKTAATLDPERVSEIEYCTPGGDPDALGKLSTGQWEFECHPKVKVRMHTWHSSVAGSAIDVTDSQMPSI